MGSANAKLVSKVIALVGWPWGNNSTSDLPALARSARNCTTAGMDGGAVTVTMTMEYESDEFPQEAAVKIASNPTSAFALFTAALSACRGLHQKRSGCRPHFSTGARR